MANLFNLIKRNRTTWEGLFNPQELDLFYSEVQLFLQSQDYHFSFQGGYVVSSNNLQEKINLENLAKLCHDREKDQWPTIIAEYFIQIRGARKQAVEYSMLDFKAISKKIVVRLWSEGSLAQIGSENLVYKNDLPGTISVLALDLPDSIVGITPTQMNFWDKNPSELFSLGFQNVSRICKPKIIDVILADTIKTLMISKDNDYLTSTHILLLDDHSKCVGSYGTLTSVPTRDLVICYPLNKMEDIRHAGVILADVTQDVSNQSPGSISPYLYWYYKTKFEIIQYSKENKSVEIPKELCELINLE
jgi:hypothetical protein